VVAAAAARLILNESYVGVVPLPFPKATFQEVLVASSLVIEASTKLDTFVVIATEFVKPYSRILTALLVIDMAA